MTKQTLSLKLPPEVAKIMPWIVSAKASGNQKLAIWARREYEIACERARQRKRFERELEERRRAQREEDACREREFQRWLREERELRERHARWGIHYALEDGWEEIQPTQGSQKGWRRLLSEHPALCDKGRYGKWGGKDGCHANYQKRNCGRKPRKPWFK